MRVFLGTTLSIVFLAGTAALQPADARITRIEITHTEPAFGGTAFGAVGAYERLRGRAHGEVDPNDPRNAIIQDIELAPKNARGMVEYATDVEILRPVNRAGGNGILFFNIVNRGNKHGVFPFNADVPHRPTDVADNNALKHAGDGWMMREGYTLIWFGWQADVLPGNSRVTFSVPAVRNPDGTAITGVVRAELTTPAATKTLNLSSGCSRPGTTRATRRSRPTTGLPWPTASFPRSRSARRSRSRGWRSPTASGASARVRRAARSRPTIGKSAIRRPSNPAGCTS